MSPGESLRRSVFIPAAELHRRLQQTPPPVLLDIRFRHGQHDRKFAYLQGHIPGAVYVDLQNDLAGRPGGTRGNRPMPPLEQIQRKAEDWGLHPESEMSVYDDDHLLQAGRGWWILRWAGVASVRLLDGGLDAWTAAGFPTVAAVPRPARGNIRLPGGQMPQMDADTAARMAKQAILLDSRGPVNYRGGPTAAGEPARGHIPGAVNMPTPDNLDADGLTLPPEALRARFAACGVDGTRPVGVYCGGGVSAAHQTAVLASIGIPATLFVGSWSAWSGDPARPVARGPHPWGEHP